MRTPVTPCSIVLAVAGPYKGQAGRVEALSKEKDKDGVPVSARVKLDARIVEGPFGPEEERAAVVELDTAEIKVLLAH